MFIPKTYFPIFLLIITFFTFHATDFGQQNNYLIKTNSKSAPTFTNPLLLDGNKNCSPENLNAARFDTKVNTNQRVLFCETLHEILIKLNRNWSPALNSELQQIWQVFIREDVKILLMEKNVSSNIRAMTEAYVGNTNGKNFGANLYLRPERNNDKSFFPILMHELRHTFDLFMLSKNQTTITESELEKRAFRLVGKINQELSDGERASGLPAFWENNWKNLSPNEIYQKREEKIENFMRSSSAYNDLLANPQKHLVGYSSKLSGNEIETINSSEDMNDGEKLPNRLIIRQTQDQLPQEVKEISFKMEKAANSKKPDDLLRAALLNEKNLYTKMDNFVYDQNLQLQCWEKEKMTEIYELNSLITRTQNGETLFQDEKIGSTSTKSTFLPSCILDLNTIKSDATETFWSAPYLDQMEIKFNSYEILDGISVARFTVYEPTDAKFAQIASSYPNNKTFRAFVGTIFISVEDSQIIKFWGTSFPEFAATGKQTTRIFGSYGTTAIRQKLVSGIWVTTLLNAVAVTYDNDKMKPFSYVVKYQNYRQGNTDIKILDDETVSK